MLRSSYWERTPSPLRSRYLQQNPNGYSVEQQAFDGGLLDKYKLTSPTAPCGFFLPPAGQYLSMGYYDGNTVTALWNYAQNYAMSDNFFDTEFGVTRRRAT